MSISLTPVTLAVLTGVVLVAGTVNGLAGFGFAVVATMALATVFEPATAVVLMIIPILAVNLTLLRELSIPDLQSCGQRFWPLLAGALVGMLLGMALIDNLPADRLRILLGILTLAFAGSLQNLVQIPGSNRVKEGCFVETTPAMLGFGGVSGLLFGGTNVGVQIVAFLRSCELSHGLFVGVVAMVFVGLNGVRIVAAGALGLYPNLSTVGISILAGIPAIAGVLAGKRLRLVLAERSRRSLVLGLLTVIGVRLLLGGFGIM